MRQPYAHWMFTPDPEFGIKTIENRKRNTGHRGTIYIHAALRAHPDYEGLRYVTEDMIFGAILGTVDLVDVHEAGPGCDLDGAPRIDCLLWGDGPWGGGRHVSDRRIWHWQLANPQLLERPIFVKGQLGLWEYNDEREVA